MKNISSYKTLLTKEALSSLSLEDMCEILIEDEISVPEKDVFEVALMWLQNSQNPINSHAAEIIDCVRFPLMSHAELEMCVKKLEDGGFPESSYHGAIEEAQCYLRNPWDSKVHEQKTRVRCLVDVLVAVGGFSSSERASNCLQLLRLNDFVDICEKVRFGERAPVRFTKVNFLLLFLLMKRLWLLYSVFRENLRSFLLHLLYFSVNIVSVSACCIVENLLLFGQKLQEARAVIITASDRLVA